MTNYKQLCAELLEWAERTSSHYYKQADVIIRARAALAEPEVEGTINWPAYFARQAAVQEQELKAALAPPEPDPEEVKKWLVTNLVFSGMPPAPYREWNEWVEAAVSAKVIQGVHIKALNPPRPAAALAESEPEGLSLKKQALEALNEAVCMSDDSPPEGISTDQANIIRRALESLPN